MSEIVRLVVVLALAVLVMRRAALRPAAERRPWRDLAFLATVAAGGAVFGAAVAAVTAGLAPQYYRFVKGIPAGPEFVRTAMLVGGQAGFGAFGVGAAVIVLTAPAGAGVRAVARVLWIPVLVALGLAAVAAALQASVSPFPGPAVARSLDPADARVVAVAWTAIVGLYLGGLLGLVVAAVRLRRPGPRP